jgi:glutamyl-tRNA synthetase
MGISHVIRGNEYLSSTPKYNIIYQAFGWTDPIYVHVPPVMKDEFHKLSKRNGDASFQDLRAKGILSEAIINYIALLGWAPVGEQEIFSLEELVKAFSIDRITKSGSIFDFNKLKWMNGVYLRNKTMEEFHELCLPYYTNVNPEYDLVELSKSLQNRVEMLAEIPEMIDFINNALEFDVNIYTHKKMKTNPENSLEALKWVKEEIENVDFSNTDAINQFMMDLAAKHEVKNGRIMWPVRVALSNKAVTPCGAGEIAKIIGKEETIKRLDQAILDLSK